MTSQNLLEERKGTSETQIMAIPKKPRPKFKLFIPFAVFITGLVPLTLYFSAFSPNPAPSVDSATPEAVISLHEDRQYSTLQDRNVAAAIGNLGRDKNIERQQEANEASSLLQVQPQKTGSVTNKQTMASVSGARPNPSDADSRFIMPSAGRLTSSYGIRWGKLHAGIDIAAPIGTPVLAVKSGIVIAAGMNAVGHGYGNGIDIRHQDGSISRYAHAEKILVRVGQSVKQGTPIMLMGCTGHCTGPHLHFELHVAGNPVDPKPYLP
jgi:murein DD-endopeptidase MepM/ murein hydrolase activator NlpD